MIFLYLFITFFEIGLFGFGGGYGMLSLIQGEVVMHHQWLTTAQFTDIVAISTAPRSAAIPQLRMPGSQCLWLYLEVQQRPSHLCFLR